MIRRFAALPHNIAHSTTKGCLCFVESAYLVLSFSVQTPFFFRLVVLAQAQRAYLGHLSIQLTDSATLVPNSSNHTEFLIAQTSMFVTCIGLTGWWCLQVDWWSWRSIGEGGCRGAVGHGEPCEGGSGGRHHDGCHVFHEEEEALLMKQLVLSKQHILLHLYFHSVLVSFCTTRLSFHAISML